MTKRLMWLAAITAVALAAGAQAKVTITEAAGQRCIQSDGMPGHETGRFPNSGNPNRLEAQDLRYCVTLTPERGAREQTRVQTVGVALNGIPIRPGTADYYDADSPRGFSRDPASGWRMEGKGNAAKFGIDMNNAHVDARGLYHYHGMPADLVRVNGDTLMGYAADGFEIHYRPDLVQSSYVLKSGARPSAPYGPYDGQFVEDWAYQPGAGNLDLCNGAVIEDGKYVYFATDTYPFFPRCLWGQVSSDFTDRRGPQGMEQSLTRPGGPREMRRPPREHPAQTWPFNRPPR